MDLLDLFAKISLDSSEYESGLHGALSTANSVASSIGSTIASGLKVVGAASVAAVGAAVTGVSALTTSAVNSYADYEQLAGGIETLYAGAENRMLRYAQQAYATAGLSANEYMETATTFAASLVNSLDGDTREAAYMANQAIIDMADNANKMGTDMEMIQNAYAGFARGNFSMLDNLKLGYAGSKEGMEELIAKANELKIANGEMGDLSIESYADMVEAIHIVQEDMGIAGTTAEEAATTISGSLSMLQSAWQNVLTGIADENANWNQLMDNLVSSAGSVVDNLIPRIEESLGGISTLISNLAPALTQALPELASELIPVLISSASDLVNLLMQVLPPLLEAMLPVLLSAITQVIQLIAGALPNLIGTLVPIIISAITTIINAIVPEVPNIIKALATALTSNIGDLIQAGKEIFTTVIDTLVEIIPEVLPVILDIGLQILTAIMEGIIENVDTVMDAVMTVIDTLVEFITQNLPAIVTMGITILLKLIEGLTQAIPQLVAYIPQIVESIVTTLISNLPLIVQAGVELLVALVADMPAIIEAILGAIYGLLEGMVEGLVSGIENMAGAGLDLFMSFLDGITSSFGQIMDTLLSLGSDILDWLWDGLSSIADVGLRLVQGLWNGINDAVDWVLDKIKGFGEAVIDGICDFFGIFSPSRVMRDRVGKYLAQGIAVGFEDEDVMGQIEDSLNTGIKNMDIDQIEASTSVFGENEQGQGLLTQIVTSLDAIARGDATITIPITIGDEAIETIILDASRNVVLRSGGMVSV